MWSRSLLIVVVLAAGTDATAQILDLPAPPARAAAREALPDPAAIIARHVEATGGREAYESIRTRHVVGTFRQGDQHVPSRLEAYHVAPDRRHVTLRTPGAGRRVFVVDGEESWTREGEILVVSEDEQRRQELRRAVLDLPVRWREHYALATTLGSEDLNGRPAWTVRLMADDCHQVIMYFDRESGRLVRATENIAYGGATIQADATYSDYRRFDGIWLPATTRRILQAPAGRIIQLFEVEQVEHDVEVPDGLFARPPELGPE